MTTSRLWKYPIRSIKLCMGQQGPASAQKIGEIVVIPQYRVSHISDIRIRDQMTYWWPGLYVILLYFRA
ncbi:hypothetical protein DTO280E4_7851 [Paecilomyces variotii]|nr:hypothetical protein DTO169E5_3845 [Paecilomyces variotii]KAJ9352311.1 hypothetical protein DTO280E4_7851 [Paecilomyces variotii]